MGITRGKALAKLPRHMVDTRLQLPKLVHTGIVVGRDPVGLATLRDDIDRSRKGTGAKHTGGGS